MKSLKLKLVSELVKGRLLYLLIETVQLDYSPLDCLFSLLLKFHQSQAVPDTVHSRLGGGLHQEDILGRERGDIIDRKVNHKLLL